MKTKKISLRVENSVFSALENLRNDRYINVSTLIRTLINKYLQDDLSNEE